MFKYLLIIFALAYSAFSLTSPSYFTCNSKLIQNNNIYSSVFSYNLNKNIIQNKYQQPINMIEYIEFNNNIKYKICSTKCDAELYYADIPKLTYLTSDTYVKTIDDIVYLTRKNDYITSYTIKDGFISSVNYSDLSYQTFTNCAETELLTPELSSCPMAQCTQIADIIFVIDESGSIIDEEFAKTKTFMIDMINYYDLSVDSVNVGIVLFAESARIVSDLTYNKQNLITLINNMAHYKGGTCISCGLDVAMSMLDSKSNYRKSLDPKNIIITVTDGEANKPVKNNNNKYHTTNCYSYGNCNNSCTDGSTIISQKCSDFCPNNNKNKCINNICYIYRDNAWFYDIRNKKCNINNVIYRNDCCINGADDCCCERVPVIGGCWFGDYDAQTIKTSANNIKIKNITSVAIGIRDASINQLTTFAESVHSINSYSALDNLKKVLIEDTCTTEYSSSCNKDCLGFCGCNKQCYCTECVESTNDYCSEYKCQHNDYSSSGCVKSDIICKQPDACHTLTRVPEQDGCCVYDEIDCIIDNKCVISGCSAVSGCYYDNVICNDDDPCTIDTCDPNIGCIYTPDLDICEPDTVCVKLNSVEHICSHDCEYGASCGEDNKCGDWSCIDNTCVYNSYCIPDNCHILTKCNPDLEDPCVYVEKSCPDLNKCKINGKCIEGECVYEDKQCISDNLCKTGKCDPIQECIYEDIDCFNGDLCLNYTCIEHIDYGNYSCEYEFKCEDIPCKNVKCSLNGQCIYTDIVCNDIDPCFTYSCINDKCKKNILNITALNPCSECMVDYHAMGLYLDYNSTLCEGNKTGFDLDVALISAGAVAAIVVSAIIVTTGITIGGTKGIHELVKRANAANTNSAHTNPLYQPNDNELVNPMHELNT